MAINKKKRTGLDSFGLGAEIFPTHSSRVDKENKSSHPGESAAQNSASVASEVGDDAAQQKRIKNVNIVTRNFYAHTNVFEQWRVLAFTERKKMHDLLVEGLDRVFADRGLKSIADLTRDNSIEETTNRKLS